MAEGKIRLLLVEDEAIIALAHQMKLGKYGIEVVGTAGTGRSAYDLALLLRPDVILMDIRLKGGMNGIEAVQAIHRELFIPVLYTSAYDDAEILASAATTCHEGILSKPLELDDLPERLRLILERHPRATKKVNRH